MCVESTDLCLCVCEGCVSVFLEQAVRAILISVPVCGMGALAAGAASAHSLHLSLYPLLTVWSPDHVLKLHGSQEEAESCSQKWQQNSL